MFRKTLKNRQYNYQPRFYNPMKDPDERKKRKLGLNRGRRFHPKKNAFLRNMIILAIIIVIYLRFTGII